MADNKVIKDALKSGMWQAAIPYDSETMAFTVREVLTALGYKFSRDRETRHFQKYIAGLVPTPQFTYVFVFKVHKPVEFIIKLYDTVPTQSGVLHFIEVDNIEEKNLDAVQKFLQTLISKMPRNPWKFFWSERFRYALLAPEYLNAKKKWKGMLGDQ